MNTIVSIVGVIVVLALIVRGFKGFVQDWKDHKGPKV